LKDNETAHFTRIITPAGSRYWTQEAAAILFALNQTYGTPPLDEKELARLMKSALKTHPAAWRLKV